MNITRSIKKKISSILVGLGQNLVLPSPTMLLRKEIDTALTNSKINITSIFESNILSCLSEAIRSGIGCGFLPIAYVVDEIKKNRISVIGPKDGYWTHNIYLYIKRDEIKHVAQSFINIANEFIN